MSDWSQWWVNDLFREYEAENKAYRFCINGQKHIMRAYEGDWSGTVVYKCQKCIAGYPHPLGGGFYKQQDHLPNE